MNIAIFGLGLIGGSLGRALKKNTEHTIFGADIDESALLKAKLLGAIDSELVEGDYKNLDMVIFATTPNTAINLMKNVCPKLSAGTMIIDSCGTKGKITSAMSELQSDYSELFFAGAHPMAGREFSGINHSMAGLFDRAYIIIVPVTEDVAGLSKLKSFFHDMGCLDVVFSSADNHDEIIAYTSQLAHIVSSAYIKNPLALKHMGFSAGSFRDMTRVARLNADMWTELMSENSDKLVGHIEELIIHLNEYKQALADKDYVRLHDLLADGNRIKELSLQLARQGVNND